MSRVTEIQDYKILQVLNEMSSDKLMGILNSYGAANLTVCPKCGVDDFTHVEGCDLYNNLTGDNRNGS